MGLFFLWCGIFLLIMLAVRFIFHVRNEEVFIYRTKKMVVLMELREAGTISDTEFFKRLADLHAVPYETMLFKFWKDPDSFYS